MHTELQVSFHSYKMITFLLWNNIYTVKILVLNEIKLGKLGE